MGDATNYVIVFAGELLSQAETLLRMGMNVNDVITGFEKALQKSMEILDSTLNLPGHLQLSYLLTKTCL